VGAKTKSGAVGFTQVNALFYPIIKCWILWHLGKKCVSLYIINQIFFYHIFDNKTLQEIAYFLPNNEAKFLQINGVGAVKYTKIASSTSYLGGADFLTTLGLLDLKCVARISTDAFD
jgi:hypothetical protein